MYVHPMFLTALAELAVAHLQMARLIRFANWRFVTKSDCLGTKTWKTTQASKLWFPEPFYVSSRHWKPNLAFYIIMVSIHYQFILG